MAKDATEIGQVGFTNPNSGCERLGRTPEPHVNPPSFKVIAKSRTLA